MEAPMKRKEAQRTPIVNSRRPLLFNGHDKQGDDRKTTVAGTPHTLPVRTQNTAECHFYVACPRLHYQ